MGKFRYKTAFPLIQILLALIMAGSLYSQDNSEKFKGINLVDTSLGYPILKSILESGFFRANNFNVNYIPSGDKSISRKEDINLLSSLKEKNGIQYSAFKIYSKNLFNQSIRLSWEVPRNDDFDSLREESMEILIRLAIKTRENDVNELLLGDFLLSDNVKALNVSYYDDDKGSHIRAYDFTYETDPSSTHKFWRALGEMTFLNGLGVAHYWIMKDENMEDWEYKPNREGFKDKMIDGWSLDSNAFRTNTLYHIYSGAIYYQAARSCGYGYVGSTLWTFAASLMWEYIGEYREQVSMNDMIFTPLGGLLLGEALRMSSIYLERRMRRGILRHIAVFLLDPMRILNRGIDRLGNSGFRVNLIFMNPAQTLIERAAMGNAKW